MSFLASPLSSTPQVITDTTSATSKDVVITSIDPNKTIVIPLGFSTDDSAAGGNTPSSLYVSVELKDATHITLKRGVAGVVTNHIAVLILELQSAQLRQNISRGVLTITAGNSSAQTTLSVGTKAYVVGGGFYSEDSQSAFSNDKNLAKLSFAIVAGTLTVTTSLVSAADFDIHVPYQIVDPR